MFINHNDFNKLAESLAEILDRFITPQELEKLSEGERKRLCSLRYKWTLGENVIPEMKDILGIKSYLGKKEVFLKMKFNK